MHASWNALRFTILLFFLPSFLHAAVGVTSAPSVADYESIQAAVDDNAGRAIYVPAGDYRLTSEISISTDGTELFGHRRLIQPNPKFASQCRDVLVEGNRVIEDFLQATPAMKAKYEVGDFVDRNAERGALVSKETWRAGYVNNWHQGSAIIVSSTERTAQVRPLNNHIENAAQGIDIHADHVTVQGNIVVNSFIGLKAMHGSRYTLIANNQFSKSVLWAIGLMPGASSRPGNKEGDSIITGNIISEFGYGDAAWIWPTIVTPVCR